MGCRISWNPHNWSLKPSIYLCFLHLCKFCIFGHGSKMPLVLASWTLANLARILKTHLVLASSLSSERWVLPSPFGNWLRSYFKLFVFLLELRICHQLNYKYFTCTKHPLIRHGLLTMNTTQSSPRLQLALKYCNLASWLPSLSICPKPGHFSRMVYSPLPDLPLLCSKSPGQRPCKVWYSE